MIDYAQESGRAGRDGLPAKAILVTTEEVIQDFVQLMKRGGIKNKVDDALSFKNLVLDCQSCMRQRLQTFLDGHGSTCILETSVWPGVEKCWVCEAATCQPANASISGASSSGLNDPEADAQSPFKKQKTVLSADTPSQIMARLARRHAQYQRSFRDRLKGYLYIFRHDSPCPICYVLGLQGSLAAHNIGRCKQLFGIGDQTLDLCLRCLDRGHTTRGCSVEIKFRGKGHCFICSLPQIGEDKSEYFHFAEGAFGNRQLCDSGGKDVILPVAWFVYRHANLFFDASEFIQDFGFHDSGLPTPEKFASWLTQSSRQQILLVNATCVFVWGMDRRARAGEILSATISMSS